MAVVDLQVLSDALAGDGEASGLDIASTLITVDGGGYPFVCLLSKRQLTVRATQVVALVQSRRTLANLERVGRATLHLVHDDASVVATLELHSALAMQGGTLLYFEVSTLESERRSTILTPIMYQLDEGILVREGSSIEELMDGLDAKD